MIHRDGSFRVRAPAARVWAQFMEPARLSEIISDPHTIETVDATHLRGTIKTGVGFIRGTFRWSASFEDVAAPTHARIRAQGTGMGSGLDLSATLDVAEAGGESTLTWAADVSLTGTVATLAASILDGTIEKKVGELFDNARKRIETG